MPRRRRLPLRFGSAAELGRHARMLDPAALPRLTPRRRHPCPPALDRGPAPRRRRAGAGPLRAGRHRPRARRARTGACSRRRATASASGNHPLEALTHALCEVIERDAVALWQAAGPAAQDRAALDLASVRDPTARAWIDAVAAAGLALIGCGRSRPISGVPGLRLPDRRRGADVQPELGFGCHADPGVALLRAIGEAAQARLTRHFRRARGSRRRRLWRPRGAAARPRGARLDGARRHARLRRGAGLRDGDARRRFPTRCSPASQPPATPMPPRSS